MYVCKFTHTQVCMHSLLRNIDTNTDAHLQSSSGLLGGVLGRLSFLSLLQDKRSLGLQLFYDGFKARLRAFPSCSCMYVCVCVCMQDMYVHIHTPMLTVATILQQSIACSPGTECRYTHTHEYRQNKQTNTHRSTRTVALLLQQVARVIQHSVHIHTRAHTYTYTHTQINTHRCAPPATSSKCAPAQCTPR